MRELLEIQQGEGKWVKFTVTRNSVALSLSGATLFFGMKQLISDTIYVYSVDNADDAWDKSEAADGIVRVNIPASVTSALEVGTYIAQARMIVTADTDVEKTQTIVIQIVQPVIH